MTDWPGAEETQWPGTAEPQEQQPAGMNDADREVAKTNPGVQSLMQAFNTRLGNFRNEWGPEAFGLSEESQKWLRDKGVLPKDSGDAGFLGLKSFNEAMILPAAAAMDAAMRSPQVAFHAIQRAITNVGLPSDVAALPDAFPVAVGLAGMGGVPRIQLAAPKPFVKPVEVQPVRGSPNPDMPNSIAATGADPLIDKILQHPVMREVVDNPVVDDSHTIPNSWGGSEPINNPTIYRDSEFPKTMSVDGVTFDTSKPAAIHENVEQFAMNLMVKGGMDEATALKVAFWHFGEPAEDAFYTAHGINHEHAEAAIAPYVDRIAGRGMGESTVPSDLFKDTYPDGDPAKAAPGPIDKPTFEEVSQGRAIIQKYFDDNPQLKLEAEARGVPYPKGIFNPSEARDLGVIGPEREPVTDGTPAEAAARTIAAGRAPDEKITQEVGGGNPWQERFEQFVSKLEAPGDVKQLIRDAAKENDDFLPARQGDIPLRHVQDIADAAGVDASEINQRGLGRLLRNDAEVRTAMQLMLQATENVKNAARDVKAGGDLIKLQEAIMRRDLAVEQVVGLRAEWGRTGNVIQEFLRDVKDQEGLNNFLKGKGRSPKDLRDLADAIDTLDGAQAAKMLNDARKPDFFDKFMWYWTNALISGPITHAKYVIANAAFAGYESAVVTPVAGAIGTARRALRGDREGVFIGEAPARLWGMVAGTPDAIRAAVQAARTGLQTPLPGEIAQNIIPKQNKNVAFQQKPIPGALGTAIGLPSRGAAAIHSFFNFLGYRASIEAQAYRTAAKEGLKPTADTFWQRREAVAANPDADMMSNAIEEGYRLTYLTELGPTGKAISHALQESRVGRLVLPFTHIPFNILSRGIEGTPAAFLSSDARADLFGKNGAVKQDMATARLVAGSAIGAWAMNQILNDRMTGYGPTDPTERSDWLATGHQPYSIRLGDYWYSFNRFGSIGTMLGLYSNLGEAMPHIKPDSDELTKALTMTVHATGRLLEDEVGMQGLAGLMEAIDEPERKGTRFVSNFAGSMLPYSSLLRQTASAMDPYMRETKSVVDGLRYYIPNVRQGLRPKLDWLGEPIANAGYGLLPIQHRQVNNDPVALEMQELGLHAAPPQDRIGTVKLTPDLYDQYQVTAGSMTRPMLEQLVSQPGWHDVPAWVRADTFKKVIAASRESARAVMQGTHPEIPMQGVENIRNRIEGNKPTKLQAP